MTRAKKSQFLILTVLVLASALVYSNSLQNGFVYDDEMLIVGNERIHDWHNLLSHFSLYRPVRWVTYTADYHVWGSDPFGYHLTNVLVHISCVILLFLVASKLSKHRLLPFAAALLFALHPIQTEAVNNIAYRTDLLATFFLLLSLGLYMRRSRSIWFYAFSVLSFGLALLSKEAVGIAIPVILVAYDVFFTPRVAAVQIVAKNLRYYLIYGIVIVLGVALGPYGHKVPGLIARVSQEIHASGASSGNLYGTSLAMWLKAISENVRLLFFPYGLCADYPFPRVTSPFEASVVASLFVCIALIFVAARTYARWRVISFGIFWILVTLLPVINVVPLTPHFVAERYLYPSSIGFCLALGALIDGMYHGQGRLHAERRQQSSAILFLLILLGFYSVSTYRRNFDWNSDLSLWSKAAEQKPESTTAHVNLGGEYALLGHHDRAIEELRKAIRLAPELEVAHYDLGNEYRREGLFDEAIQEYKRALQINSGSAITHSNLGIAYEAVTLYDKAIEEYEIAVEINPRLAQPHCNLGALYGRRGLYDKAVKELEQAVQVAPGLASARCNLGITYVAQGLYDKAVKELEQAVQLDPSSALAHCNLGIAYAGKGLYDRATDEQREAIRIDPRLGKAYCGLGDISLAQGALDEGIRQFTRAIELDPSLGNAHYDLAIAYLRKGLLDRAREEYRKAVEINPAFSAPPYGLKPE